MLKGENWWTWERAIEHASLLSNLHPDNRYRVYKTSGPLGWTVAYARQR